MSDAWKRRAAEAAISGVPWTLPSNGDVPCPNDGELVNKRCWKCGWIRDVHEASRMGWRCSGWTYPDGEYEWRHIMGCQNMQDCECPRCMEMTGRS